MPSASIATDPRGNKITFTEADHKYVTRFPSLSETKAEVQIEYVSTTKLISKYSTPFDPTGEITARCAERNKISVEEMKKRWKDEADASCIVGTHVHEVCEDILKGLDIRNTPLNDREQALMAQAFEIAWQVKQSMEILGVEKIVFDIDLQVAGTIDALVRDPDGVVHIIDWKTNKNIERENKYNKFMTGILSGFPDTTFNHYSLQLSLYHLMLVRCGYLPPDTKIVQDIFHIQPDKVEHLEIPFVVEQASDIMYEQAVTLLRLPF